MASDIAALLTRPALELAGMVRSGTISARELVEAALGRIEDRKDLNAFTLVDAEGALAAADAIKPGDPRPFAGVPTAIKELNLVAGQRLTMGSNLFGDFVAPVDNYVVRRLRDAGFVFVGRTNAPEFGIVPTTEPRRFGASRNPWDTTRSTGGSSGGAAASVAAGILPVAQGSDGGGSIRIPAACCGLFGLKPSRGRISAGPELGDAFLSTSGALTRNVADSAAMLDAMAGYELGDATWAPAPAESFAAAAARTPTGLRIAMTTLSPIGTPVDPICAQAVHDAAALLTSLGHHVEEATPPNWRAPELEPIFNVLYAGGIATSVRFGGTLKGAPVTREDIEALSWGFYTHGTTLSAADYFGAMTQLQGVARQIIGFCAGYDLLLMPSLAQRPLPLGTIDTSAEDWLAEFHKAAVFTPFTAVWNITGQPAMSVPLYHGADGLPLGVQFVAPPLAEGLLLSLATQLEEALPWAARVPGM